MALAACALWLTGVEILPALHEALHDRLAPHRHDSGAIITVSFEDTTHRHPDGSIHFVTPKTRAARAAAQGDRARATSPGAGHADGLAHHAAALAPVQPPVTEPLPVDRRASWLALEPLLALVARGPLAATARGPPGAA